MDSQTVQVVDGKDLDWRMAIKKAADPLVQKKLVGNDYVDKMIQVVDEQGPYINIGPNIALAHARPCPSVKKVSLSLMKTNQPINLVNDQHPVRLWFVFQELSALLMNAENTQKLLEAESVEEILDVLGHSKEV